MFCITCGKENADDAEYCLGCGRKLSMLRDDYQGGADSYIPPSQRPKNHTVRSAEPATPTVSEPSVAPAAQPAQPTYQPVTPAAQPAQPTYQPVQPAPQPAQPTYQPVQPAPQPVQPTYQPVQPAPQPAPQPVVQQVVQPVYTVAQPVYTVAQPVYTVPQPTYARPVAPPPAYPPQYAPRYRAGGYKAQLVGEARENFEAHMRTGWRRLAGGPAMIIFCVLMTVQFLSQIASVFLYPEIAFGAYAASFVSEVLSVVQTLGLIPVLILLIGLWICCGDGFRQKTLPPKTTGITMVRGVFITYQVLAWIGVGCLALALVVSFAEGGDYYVAGSSLLMPLIIAYTIIFVMLFLFLNLILRVLANARRALEHGVPNRDRATATFVVAIILASVSLLTTVGTFTTEFYTTTSVLTAFVSLGGSAMAAVVAGQYRSWMIAMERDYQLALDAQKMERR